MMSTTDLHVDRAVPAVRTDAEIEAVVDAAVRRVAPLWSLEAFVAVNPWFGLADLRADEAAVRMAQVAGARATLPRGWYLKAIEEGRIERHHLDRALAAAHASAHRRAEILHGLPTDATELEAHLRAAPDVSDVDAPAVGTVADAATSVTGVDWGHFVVEHVSAWAASHFDEGQSAWPSPFRELGVWEAFRAEAVVDRSPKTAGLEGFADLFSSLPLDAAEARTTLLRELGVEPSERELYLHRLLMRVGGWSAWVRRRLWDAELHGGTDPVAHEFVTILLAWEVALLRGFTGEGIESVWQALRQRMDREGLPREVEIELRIDLALQDAFERAEHDRLVARFPGASPIDSQEATDRPAVQAAFCIDVRSEVYRRSLERVAPEVETIGFAGFFGAAVEYVGVGETDGLARCPVLLTPAATVRETADDAETTRQIGQVRSLRRRSVAAWKWFKMGAVSCFGFVGPVGLAYAAKLIGDGFGWTRPSARPGSDALTSGERALLRPDLEVGEGEAAGTGIADAARVDTAEGILRGMSLTERIAELVLLVGHGSTTTNNPHATGLDCGACGGQGGEVNARVAATLLNDPAVRDALAERGIDVPPDTLFVAAVHDTCTDDVTCFPPAGMDPAAEAALARLRDALALASAGVRAERAPSLGVMGKACVDDVVRARARDWSQVRPEWGLAGCSAFVAAPRSRTAGLDLDGRSFLHSYDWRADEDFSVLELILTAPVVVASWISLQYYGSTVDNEVYGSGNKTLHNVVGTLGVLEGNGGDLRVGLPLQSVHDGTDVAHEPLRLNVVVEAPREAMNEVITRHEHLRHLVDHGWVHLWAMDEGGALSHRYAGGGRWVRVGRRGLGAASSPEGAAA